MNIRRIENRDRERYLEMARTFYSSDAVMSPIPESYFEDTFDELMRSDMFARCYILEYDGKTVGYGLTARTFSQEAGGIAVFIEELYIDAEYRSKGFGSRFFEYLFHDEPNAKRFRLEVEDTNPRAIELYKRLGFDFLEYLQMYKTV